jgi:tripartite-type tricarboxylate transporter receptor subunit TctC
MTAATRRLLLGAAATALPPLAFPARAQQQRWEPSRPIALLVGFAPGGGTDIISRLLQPAMQADLGQPITVENRPGASGTIAALAGTARRPTATRCS